MIRRVSPFVCLAALLATTELQAQGLSQTQLQNQLSSVSGVSLDEEAANLIQYQSAYEAAAQMISTINQMSQTVLNWWGTTTA